MPSILKTCEPRPDLIAGSFNPELFTASLSQVMDFYRGKPGVISNVYTQAEPFFREATYPTHGFKDVLLTTFKRLSGDNTVSSIRRLETAFGGGKTHALIALTHLAFQGKKLAPLVGNFVPEDLLAKPGAIQVVGFAGDKLPVHRTIGAELTPYTLWGEIAFQVGGEALYKKLEAEVTSFGAPGENYFNAVLGGKKVLIMMDELAQYATRLEAARPDGGDELAAFMMGLHGYARDHAGVAIVLTLASARDAFAKQTKRLAELLSQVRGEVVDEDQALEIGTQAVQRVASVAARDAAPAIPVLAKELTQVLAKRLFVKIDEQGARETAEAYMSMYRANSAILPEQAVREDFREELSANYPFHPQFVRFLNEKLATLENFQGTRGVLRTLALVVRNLWGKQVPLPMMHTCHVDLRDPYIVSEIVGRTEGGDLLPVLNTDVGGPDTENLAYGLSYAQQADRKNPHPLGHPLYEYVWRTVFLHSLVGRADGIQSNLFGITEPEALFSVAFPEMTPPQVQTALQGIINSALYLKQESGKYFASLEPTINKPLGDIMASLKKEQIEEVLASTARKVVTADRMFQVLHDISEPGHIPDDGKKPNLALVALDAREFEALEFITTVGKNRPRIHQNQVFLLIPKTVREKTETWGEGRSQAAKEMMNRLEGMARLVKAMGILKENPENYGIRPIKLLENNFDTRVKERNLALLTTVTQSYDSLWYPSTNGQLVRKEVQTGGGEGGAPLIEAIKETLKEEGELISSERALTTEVLTGLSAFFFSQTETPGLPSIRADFTAKRNWPILEDPSLLDQIFKEGVKRGKWCLFQMAGAESQKPEAFYCSESGPLPLTLNLSDKGWSLITAKGAKQRQWWPTKIDEGKIEQAVKAVMEKEEPLEVAALVEKVCLEYGDVPEQIVLKALEKQVQYGKLAVFTGKPEQTQKPQDLVFGTQPSRPVIIKPSQIVATPANIAKKGWVTPAAKPKFELTGKPAAEKILPLLDRLGSLYNKGAKSKITFFSMMQMEIPKGGKMSVTLEDVPPESMKALGEFFETLKQGIVKGNETEVDLVISDPQEECLLIKTLKDTKVI